MPVIERQIQVSFRHQVHFTHGIFNASNRLLRDVMSSRSGERRQRALVVETLKDSKSPSCLLQSHGVFALGKSAEAAIKAAVMTEDNAAIVWLASQLGTPLTISDEDIAKLHHRYTNVYGQ